MLTAGLKRYPHHARETLQAWDSADELLLQHMSTAELKNSRILIINDQFGAICCSLKDYDITHYTDSFISEKGIRINSGEQIQSINSLAKLSGIYHYVLIRIPKNMSFFEDTLAQLTGHLDSNSKIIATAMVKHLAKTSFELLQKYIGETTTSLAQKKARLIFSPFQKEKTESPYPLSISVDSFEKRFVNHSNLFSREKLDIGTRFFLEHIPQGNFQKILDLGCANGIIGIMAKKLNPDAKIIFSDESAMAVESTKTNYQNYFSDDAQYLWTNCFEDQEANSLDLVLCNPPFHQQSMIDDQIALQMFRDSHHSLKKGGKIRVIGNSHLGYQLVLKKVFGNSTIIATNQKFMIVDAVKT